MKYLISLRFFKEVAIVLFCALFGVGSLAAEPLTAGDTFPALEGMLDQHETAYQIPKSVRHVAVAFTMSVGKKANQALAKKGAGYLAESNAVFIANIYGMPAVGRFFAIPKMQKYPHRIMLADSESLLEDYPRQEDKVTIFDLDETGRIVTIRFWDPQSEASPF